MLRERLGWNHIFKEKLFRNFKSTNIYDIVLHVFVTFRENSWMHYNESLTLDYNKDTMLH